MAKVSLKILKLSNFEAGWSQGNDGLEVPTSDQVCALPAQLLSRFMTLPTERQARAWV